MSTRAGSTRTIAVVSGGLSNPSSTRLLADRLTAATVEALKARGDDATVAVSYTHLTLPTILLV